MKNNKTIIAFLTKTPNNHLIDIAIKLSDYFKIFIFIDDNSFKYEKDDRINYIQIDNNICINNGFQYTLEIFLHNAYYNFETDKKISSYDKFFYHFCMLDLDYDYIWIIEDDVFIPDIKNIINFPSSFT